MELQENENDFGDGFFSGEDETPVDMEMIKEKIKLVPLSDMDFDEPPDDVMDVDCSTREEILAPLNLTPPDHSKLEDAPKQLQHKGLEEGATLKPSKILSIEMQSSVEAGDTTATAAKVAAEVAPDVVTGGVVAEAGPPPDFSLWTVEDDILLKNAMEAGAAIEALAKGAVKFSQHYTARELRERWRALLYDPVISEEAALRMLKSEALVTNPGKLSNPNKLKYPQVSNRKRKLKSVRFHYYKRKKNNAAGKVSKILTDKDNDDMDSFPVDGAGEAAEGIPFVTVDGAQQEDSTFTGRLAQEVTPVEAPDGMVVSIAPAQQGAKTSLPQQASTVEYSLGASNISSAEEQYADAHRSSNPGDLNVSQVKPSQLTAQEGTVEMKGTCASDTVTAFDKPLIVVPVLEQMICVLNTEDTDIPSPPSGSATHLPSLFSPRYYPLEMKSIKNEPGFLGGGYGRTDEFDLSGHGLMRSVSMDRRTVGSLIKQEPMLEGLECDPKYSVNVQGSLSATHSVTVQSDDKEAFEHLENAGGHALKSVLLASQANTDDLSAVPDLALLHSDAPGFSKELVLPLQTGILGQLEQGLCYTDQTAGDLAMKRSALSYQEHEDGLESDKELPSFSDVEAMILDMDLDPVFDEDALARAASRRLYRRQRKTLMRLEQGAKAALERALTHREAIAVLYGHHLRYYIKRNKVLLGRVTLDNSVDIDLGKEGRANKVSRRQATIRLKEDGVFYLKNLGRRDLSVNNIPIANGQHAMLGSNCLIEVGGMRFIFEINRKLVRQRVAEMLSTRQQG